MISGLSAPPKVYGSIWKLCQEIFVVHGGLTRVGTSTLLPMRWIWIGWRFLTRIPLETLEEVFGIGFGLFKGLRHPSREVIGCVETGQELDRGLYQHPALSGRVLGVTTLLKPLPMTLRP